MPNSQPGGAPIDAMARVVAYAEVAAQEGRYPYEGQWLTIAEIEHRIRSRRRTAWVHALELLLLLSTVYLFAAASWLLISLLCY